MQEKSTSSDNQNRGDTLTAQLLPLSHRGFLRFIMRISTNPFITEGLILLSALICIACSDGADPGDTHGSNSGGAASGQNASGASSTSGTGNLCQPCLDGGSAGTAGNTSETMNNGGTATNSSAGSAGTTSASAGSAGSAGNAGSANCSSNCPSPPLNNSTEQCQIPQPSAAPNKSYIIGDGNPASCTASEIQKALNSESMITFNCGASHLTIPIDKTLTIPNNHSLSIDGNGLITLDGQDKTNIIEAGSRGQLQILNLRFIRGFGKKWGGAVSAGYLGKIEVFDSIFEDNHLSGDKSLDAHPGGGAIGGGHIDVTVVRSKFLRNGCDAECYGGGAFYVLLGNSWVYDSLFEDNLGEGSFGGAVYIENGPCCDEWFQNESYWCGVTFKNNQARERGGAISVYWTRTTIDSCHFENNSSDKWGGALSLSTAEAQMNSGLSTVGKGSHRVLRSSFVNNSGPKGAAIWTIGAENLEIENSSFSGHDQLGDSVIYQATSSLDIKASFLTIANNKIPAISGNASASGALILSDSILSYNGKGKNNLQCSRVIEYPSKNHCPTGSTLADPALGAIAQDGGLSYFPLGTQSAALHASTTCPAGDQLGEARNSPCDLGAIEQH